MKYRSAVSLFSIALFFVAVTGARADSDATAAAAKAAVSGTYSCGFDSDSGY